MSPASGRRAARQAGQTLVQTALVIAVVGAVLAVFVPTFFRTLRTSKLAEAPEQLALLHSAAAAYYGATFETDTGRVRSCFPPAAGPTPTKASYKGEEVDFAHEETRGRETWSALGYQPDRPIRFRYSFIPAKEGCGVRGGRAKIDLTLRAEADLDADGRYSLFERNYAIVDHELKPVGVLYTRDRTE